MQRPQTAIVGVAGIEAGLFEVALITYGSTQRSDRSRRHEGYTLKLTEQYEPLFGLPTPVGAYALAATRHMFEYGTTSEQLAEVAVKVTFEAIGEDLTLPYFRLVE